MVREAAARIVVRVLVPNDQQPAALEATREELLGLLDPYVRALGQTTASWKETERYWALSRQAVQALETKVEALLVAITKHRDAKAHERCWENDAELYVAAGLQPEDPELPPRAEFLDRCRRYYAQQAGVDHLAEARRRLRNTTQAARLWMLEVIACTEELGEDGMCDCAREHFRRLDAIGQDLEALRQAVIAHGVSKGWAVDHPLYVAARHDPRKR